MKKYRAATFSLTLVALAGYLCTAGGIILLLEGGISSAVPMILGGLLLVGTANFGTATIDTAKNTAAILQLMQQNTDAIRTPQAHDRSNTAANTRDERSDALARLSSSSFRSRS